MCRYNTEARLAESVLYCLLSSCKQKTFLEQFCASKESCTLVRILAFSKNVKTTEKFRTLLTLLRNHPTKVDELTNTVRHLCLASGLNENKDVSKKSLDALINDVLKTDQTTITRAIKEFMAKFKTANYQSMSKESLIKVGLHIHRNASSMFEPFIKALCVNAADQRADKLCIEVLTALIKGTGIGASGSIVDWLALLDPEMLQLNPILLRELLFTKQDRSLHAAGQDEKEVDGSNETAAPISAVSYLTSLVAHEARNSTLQDCAHWILGSTRLLKR